MSRAAPDGPSGLLVVDKPGGLTSHDVVGRVRRLAHTRKVGHAGTLDPMATGVLLLGVNRATRLLGHLALSDKAYDATVRLGFATTTDDAEGEPLPGVTPTGHSLHTLRGERGSIDAALQGMVGEVDQVPSSVSAVKVDGKRAYARVRAGEAVELPARRVRIDEITVHDVRLVEDWVDVDLSVRCSSGTYVRAIARDLGEALGVGGHLTALRRTSIGSGARAVTLADATPLDDLTEDLPLMGLGEAARRFFPFVEVGEEEQVRVGHGKRLSLGLTTGPTAVLGPGGDLLGLYAPAPAREDGDSKPVAVFL
ncbi:tRNA pseudouridine(55) synthase TruB [Nocardioides marmoribigeumensis]|uniref:tRNA pseudouridine synthase B n=1 Tax=Nocardioides marmoribigeumensis TaxID=433649 RepID=A0ABU2BS01_9ACTN|nr:tRNA pseudouridine(55) synthase TruB [Nocardioides marmoribigeumensis]MDR7361398.1 tRNA pseudouridine55 synthase [Nocardioides marmoribigeumensis]